MNKALPILASLAMISAPASALEDWSGRYYGLSLGAGFNTGDDGKLKFKRADGSDNNDAIDNAFGNNFAGKFEAGAVLGGELGMRMQSNQWVYGGAFTLSMADIAQEQSAFSATPATYVERREINALATLVGQIGYASELPILPYFTLGLAYGDVDYSWEGNSGAFRGSKGDDGDGLGYTAGIGVEFKVMDNMTAAFDYRYINVGDADFKTNFSGEQDLLGNNGAFNAFGDAASGGTNAQGTDDDFDFQIMRASLRYWF